MTPSLPIAISEYPGDIQQKCYGWFSRPHLHNIPSFRCLKSLRSLAKPPCPVRAVMSRWYAHGGRPSSGCRIHRIKRSWSSHLSILISRHHYSASFCVKIVTYRLSVVNVSMLLYSPHKFSDLIIFRSVMFGVSALFANVSDSSLSCIPLCSDSNAPQLRDEYCTIP